MEAAGIERVEANHELADWMGSVEACESDRRPTSLFVGAGAQRLGKSLTGATAQDPEAKRAKWWVKYDDSKVKTADLEKAVMASGFESGK